MAQGIAGIYSELYTAIVSNESLFPSLPEITLRLRETLNDPDCNVASAAKLLKTDPGLSAFILRMAGSARYLTRVPPSDIESAVRRIGLRATGQLAMLFFVRATFQSPTPALRRQVISSYHQATRVSVISAFIASTVKGFDSDRAMLAGLLQDISVPLILRHLVERRELFQDERARDAAIDRLAPLVGVLILKQWGFDEEMIEVARTRKQWQREGGRKPDLSDVVLIARLHSLLGTPEFGQCPSFDELPAFHKLPLGELTPRRSIRMLEQAQDEITELGRLLAAV